MDPSRLDYERSLALHEAVATRLLVEPAILDRARARVEEWIARGGRSTPLLLRWRDMLSSSPADVAAVLTDRSEDAASLRSASPFAGALDPHTRLAILRQVREVPPTGGLAATKLEETRNALRELDLDENVRIKQR